MQKWARDLRKHDVAPLVGAWIEIVLTLSALYCNCASHPSRVRGLKYVYYG